LSGLEQRRRYAGPAILSFGFRPLFFSAGLWAALAMALWLAMLEGSLVLPTDFDPVAWHVHELLFGYLPAVAAGFLFTAVPNWTGRLPLAGRPLALLAACWWLGRVAVASSAYLGTTVTAILDLAFLALLALLLAREIVAGRNWRNLAVVVLVTLLFAGNLAFHLEAAAGAAAGGFGVRVGIAVAVFLITLIGGRIVPSFTRNWLAKRSPGRLPAPVGRFDFAALVTGAAALVTWVALPETAAAALLCLVAGLVHTVRLLRWAPERTSGEALVWILHAGYLFVPIGFLLEALVYTGDFLAPTAALHAWTAGAIGVMTLAVMTRASLGHGGRPLHATAAVQAIYVMVLAAATARVVSGFEGVPLWMMHVAGAAWIGAFALFTAAFAPLFWRPRRS